MKSALIIIALVLLAGVVVFRARSGEPDAASVSDTSGGPSFEVRVEKPLSARPLFGLLPAGLFGVPAGDLRFDHGSRGAQMGSVGHDHLELSADGWNFLFETDGDGRVAAGTRLVFPMELAGRKLSLRCRPSDRASGYLRTSTRAGSDGFDGRFLVELATCENAETGRVIEWPPAPLTVRGTFEGLPHGRR